MDLTTSYAGMQLHRPVVIGASPLPLRPDSVKQLAAAGAGAIVMPSIFEEQIVDAQLRRFTSLQSSPQTIEPIPKTGPDLDAYNGGTLHYLHAIEAAKSAAEIPLIASVNCLTTGDWMNYATEIESAGADAIEVNLYHYPMDPDRFAEDIEKELIDRVHQFCNISRLPVSIKLLPQFTCLPNIAFRIAGAGATSLCLFGQSPSFEIKNGVRVDYRWRTTTRADLQVSLEGIRQVRGAVHNLTLAASGGIQSPDDAIAAVRLGADVLMITSAIYEQGVAIIEKICDGLANAISNARMISLKEMIGSQGSGYNPFREATRRDEYSSSIVETAGSETMIRDVEGSDDVPKAR